MQNVLKKEKELIGCLTVHHWKDKFFCIIWRIKWFKSTHGYILNSKIFPTTPHMPKSKLKRRSYGSDKLDEENYRNIENSVATMFLVATEKLCRNRENSIAINFFIAYSKLGRDKVF